MVPSVSLTAEQAGRSEKEAQPLCWRMIRWGSCWGLGAPVLPGTELDSTGSTAQGIVLLKYSRHAQEQPGKQGQELLSISGKYWRGPGWGSSSVPDSEQKAGVPLLLASHVT